MTTSAARFFVSLDEHGKPLFQRNTLKARPYLAASYDGTSFSSSPPNGAYPRKVIEVAKSIEWVSRATLEDGTKVSDRSKKGPTAPNFVRYIYTSNYWDTVRNGQPTGVPAVRSQRDTWTTERTPEAWLKVNTGLQGLNVEVVAFALGSRDLLNWPTPGDSIALPDGVQS